MTTPCRDHLGVGTEIDEDPSMVGLGLTGAGNEQIFVLPLPFAAACRSYGDRHGFRIGGPDATT